MYRAYLSLGSNIGDRKAYLRAAVKMLKAHKDISVTAISPVYETEPEGYENQRKFYNLVLEIETKLNPENLLDVCRAIEEILKRKRKNKWGPRTIDLDILLYDDLEIREGELVLPHPRMHERLFVLIPLLEIAPQLKLRGGLFIKDYLDSKVVASDSKESITLVGSLYD